MALSILPAVLPANGRSRAVQGIASAQLTVTSVTYTDAGPAVLFTAPPSGSVLLVARSEINHQGGGHALMSPIVQNASGATVVVGGSDDDAITYPHTVNSVVEVTRLITGLTPGVIYQANIHYRCTTGTSYYNRRNIKVNPVI